MPADSGHSAPTERGSMRGATLGAFAMLACIVFFTGDIVVDVAEHIANLQSYRLGHLIHLLFEGLAVVGLVIGVQHLRHHIQNLRLRDRKRTETLSMLRGQFDQVLKGKFADWRLTQAEQDVTLLMLRGLSIAQIADARKTAQGTIKAQSSAIFKKIGVASKTELLSSIIDEFLDTSNN